jgi:HAD superfamily hydrolase (TIGR01509 family)
MAALRGMLLDVDGTLLDSNDAHARAWEEALADQGFRVGFQRIRRLIGMGSDKLVPSLTHLSPEDPRAERLQKRRGELFRIRLPSLRPFARARELLAALGRRGLVRVTATSATAEDMRALLKQADVADLMDATVSSDDVDRSKPDPDIVRTALDRAALRPDQAVLVGDTAYDVAAARRAGVRAIAVRSGGWRDGELDGAVAIFDDVADLFVHLDDVVARWR